MIEWTIEDDSMYALSPFGLLIIQTVIRESDGAKFAFYLGAGKEDWQCFDSVEQAIAHANEIDGHLAL